MIVIAEGIRFKSWLCDVVLAKYEADCTDALVLVDSDSSERIATATSCLNGWGFHPGEGKTAIKDYSENEGMLAVLVNAGIVEDTGERFAAGHVEFPIVRVLLREDVAA